MAALSSSNSIKPNPFALPVSLSVTTFTETTAPWDWNKSLSSSSEVLQERFPTKSLVENAFFIPLLIADGFPKREEEKVVGKTEGALNLMLFVLREKVVLGANIIIF